MERRSWRSDDILYTPVVYDYVDIVFKPFHCIFPQVKELHWGGFWWWQKHLFRNDSWVEKVTHIVKITFIWPQLSSADESLHAKVLRKYLFTLKKGENVIICYSAVLQPRSSWLNQTAGGPGTIICLTPHNSMSDPGGEAECLKQSKAWRSLVLVWSFIDNIFL